MRLAFAGTPEFAARALEGVVAAGHEVALVLTQPDRPAGRGMRPAASAVKQLAAACALPVFQPANFKSLGDVEEVRKAKPDALIVAAYGLVLPQVLLDVPPLGAWNIHASLLPRWRGAAPIQRALLAGDRDTGISIMRMEAGLDTGAVLSQRAIPIEPEDDAGSLHDKLATLGAEMIRSALVDIAAGKAQPRPQSREGVTYAAKIGRDDLLLDWTRPAAELERAVRAFRPAPGAITRIGEEAVKIWRAKLAGGSGAPGEVLEAGDAIRVACGEGALAITELQRAGAKRVSASDFLRGRRIETGARLG